MKFITVLGSLYIYVHTHSPAASHAGYLTLHFPQLLIKKKNSPELPFCYKNKILNITIDIHYISLGHLHSVLVFNALSLIFTPKTPPCPGFIGDA